MSVGRHVLDELLDRRIPVRALTRDPACAAITGGAEVVRGDLGEPEQLDAALTGVAAVYLMAMGGAPARFVDAAGQ